MSIKHVGQVIRDYQAEFPDPIVVQAGERLEVGKKVSEWAGNPVWRWTWCTDPRGKGGYVPDNFIETREDAAVARCDYSAVELTAKVGETLSIERAESGWLWCVNEQGQSGWIPVDHVAPIPASS